MMASKVARRLSDDSSTSDSGASGDGNLSSATADLSEDTVLSAPILQLHQHSDEEMLVSNESGTPLSLPSANENLSEDTMPNAPVLQYQHSDEEMLLLDENGTPLPLPVPVKEAVAVAVPSSSLPIPSPSSLLPTAPSLPSAHAVSALDVSEPILNKKEAGEISNSNANGCRKYRHCLFLGAGFVFGVIVATVGALSIVVNNNKNNGFDVPTASPITIYQTININADQPAGEEEKKLLDQPTSNEDAVLAAAAEKSSSKLPISATLSDQPTYKEDQVLAAEAEAEESSPQLSMPTAPSAPALPILDISAFTAYTQTAEEYAYKNNLEIISGSIWYDEDADGMFNGLDYFYGTVTVNLLECTALANDNNALIATSVSTVGEYGFVGVPEGHYRLEFSGTRKLEVGDDSTMWQDLIFTLPMNKQISDDGSVMLGSDVTNQENGATHCFTVERGSNDSLEETVDSGNPESKKYRFYAGYTLKIRPMPDDGSPNSCPVLNPCPSEFTGYVTCPGSHCAMFVECVAGNDNVIATHKCPLGFIFDYTLQGCNWETCCSEECIYT